MKGFINIIGSLSLLLLVACDLESSSKDKPSIDADIAFKNTQGTLVEDFATGGSMKFEFLFTNIQDKVQTVEFDDDKRVNVIITDDNGEEKLSFISTANEYDETSWVLQPGETKIWYGNYGSIYYPHNLEVGNYTIQITLANINGEKVEAKRDFSVYEFDPSSIVGSIKVSDRFDQETSVFTLGERVNFEYTATNTGDYEAIFCYNPDNKIEFYVTHKETQQMVLRWIESVYNWSTCDEYKAGKSQTFNFSWESEIDDPFGDYQVEVYIHNSNSMGQVEAEFTMQ